MRWNQTAGVNFPLFESISSRVATPTDSHRAPVDVARPTSARPTSGSPAPLTSFLVNALLLRSSAPSLCSACLSLVSQSPTIRRACSAFIAFGLGVLLFSSNFGSEGLDLFTASCCYKLFQPLLHFTFISIKAQYRNDEGHLLLILENKNARVPLDSIQAMILPPSHLKLELSSVPEAIPPNSQDQCEFEVVNLCPGGDLFEFLGYLVKFFFFL
ncbi:hypothetical protein LXL04_027515 [Taraxacum kok-saghyz]